VSKGEEVLYPYSLIVIAIAKKFLAKGVVGTECQPFAVL